MARIGWIVPNVTTEGSGGVLTIYNHIRSLSGLYDQDIYVHRSHLNESDNKRLLELNYGKVPGVNIIYGHDNIRRDYDLLIATWSLHAYKVKNTPARKKAYFIQDLEYTFFPMSDFYLWAKESYDYGLTPITIGKYMQRILRKEHNLRQFPEYYFDFTADLNTYRPLELDNIFLKEKAVCALYQPEKPRRCAEILLKSLAILKTLMPDLTVYLYGSHDAWVQPERYPQFINLGLLSREQCNELYNKCKLGFAFSSTNPSRVPFEMMAAGLPVVDLNLDNKDDFPEGLLTVGKTYEEIAIKAYEVLNDYNIYINKRADSINFMRTRPSELAYDQFRGIIKAILDE